MMPRVASLTWLIQ